MLDPGIALVLAVHEIPVAAEVTVSVVVPAAVPEGVTEVGEKRHAAPEGSPEQAKETAELKPFAGVIVTVVVPLPPEGKVRDAGDVATEKVGGTAVTLSDTPDASVRLPPVPETVME